MEREDAMGNRSRVRTVIESTLKPVLLFFLLPCFSPAQVSAAEPPDPHVLQSGR